VLYQYLTHATRLVLKNAFDKARVSGTSLSIRYRRHLVGLIRIFSGVNHSGTGTLKDVVRYANI